MTRQTNDKDSCFNLEIP